jgi:hypothetical protein
MVSSIPERRNWVSAVGHKQKPSPLEGEGAAPGPPVLCYARSSAIKPYRKQDLARVLREVLAGPASVC